MYYLITALLLVLVLVGTRALSKVRQGHKPSTAESFVIEFNSVMLSRLGSAYLIIVCLLNIVAIAVFLEVQQWHLVGLVALFFANQFVLIRRLKQDLEEITGPKPPGGGDGGGSNDPNAGIVTEQIR